MKSKEKMQTNFAGRVLLRMPRKFVEAVAETTVIHQGIMRNCGISSSQTEWGN